MYAGSMIQLGEAEVVAGAHGNGWNLADGAAIISVIRL